MKVSVNRSLIQLGLLVAVLLPAVTQAQFSFTTNNGALTIRSYTGPGGGVVIPSITNGLVVTSIGSNVFYNCWSLTSITIPDTITNIAYEAFYNCYQLTSVTIPSSVISIEDDAFAFCSGLTSLYFKGIPPSANYSIFDGDQILPVYYLPGISGWGSTFAGHITILWNPQVETDDGSFGVRTNRFGFNIALNSDGFPMVIVVEACSNFTNPVWQPLATNKLIGGSFYFSDPEWTNYPARFYRIRSP